MTFEVGIIDYKINNLKSIRKAFEKVGASNKIISSSEDIFSTKSLILPGIGAFGDGMNKLKQRDLIKGLKCAIKDGIPLLGICLGMQMFFTESEEFGLHEGLNLILGKVVSFKPSRKFQIGEYKIPHVGWNELNKSDSTQLKWKESILKNVEEKSDVYFTHSFFSIPSNSNEILATSKYCNQEYCAVAQKDNIVGTQFHPEKSGVVGLKILKNFVDTIK